MRGVAAFDKWLAAHDAAGFVVWEPVIVSDGGEPAAYKRARHARNYWDAGRSLSGVMIRAGGDPECLGQGDDDAVVWDALFDYAPGATTPRACGRTILRELPRLSE